MKRNIAVIFLSFAYSILVLHAAIPHHNHEGLFCIIVTNPNHDHDHDYCESHEHSNHSHSASNDHEHKHHHENGKHECELSTKVVIPNNSQLSLRAVEIELFESSLIGFLPDHLLNDIKPLIFYLNHTRKIYLPPPLYRIFIVEKKGLRAPPSFV